MKAIAKRKILPLLLLIILVPVVKADIANITFTGTSVNENVAIGTYVGSFNVTQVAPYHATVSISFYSGPDDSYFNIVGNNVYTAAPIDFEAKSSLTFQIFASSSGGSLYSNSYTVNVNDQNEAPTNINISNNSVDENVTNAVVGTFSTEDPDNGDSFSYTLVSGSGSSGNSSFYIDGGQLKTQGALNYEAQSSYSVRVQTMDGGGLTFAKAFTINLNDENDAPTDISLSSNTVNENEPANTTVGNLSTTDPDAIESFIYSLVSGTGSGDNSSFNISGNQLRTSASFNYETKSSYSVRVRSADSQGLSTEKALTINVADVNEAPVVSNVEMADGMGVGQTLSASYTFTDVDGDSEGTHIYTWRVANSNTGSGASTIPGATSSTFTPDISYAGKYLRLIMQVRDEHGLLGNIAMSPWKQVTSAPSDISLSSSDVDEGLPANTVVGVLSTTDADDVSFTYQLVSGTGSADNGSFNISGSNLRTSQVFDHETKELYNIRIRTTAGGDSYEEAFVITVNDVNEPPVITELVINGSLKIGEVQSANFKFEDEDDDNEGSHSYEWWVANTSGGSGAAAIGGATSPTFTPGMSYGGKYIQVRVTPRDEHGLAGAKVNSSWYSVGGGPTDIELSNNSIAENEPVNTVIGTFTSVDVDDNSFIYSLVSGPGDDDNGSFNISTDQLRSSEIFDRESKITYSIRVQTEASGDTYQESFTIVVTDENDPPVVSNLSIDGIPEIGEVLTATYDYDDEDGDSEGATTYQWRTATSGAGAGASNILGATSETFTPDFEQGGFWVQVMVTPEDDQGLEGDMVESSWIYIDAAPTFTDLLIENLVNPGVFAVGETVVADISSYEDEESDPAGTHQYQWYVSNTNSGTGTPISGGSTSQSYDIKGSEKEKYISVEVIPVATGGSSPGEPVRSPWYLISELPSASFVENDTICEGGSGFLEVMLTGEAPWSITYTIDNGPQLIEEEITDVNYELEVTVGGTYTLLQVSDNNFENIEVTSSVEVEYFEAVSANLVLEEYSICPGDAGPHILPVNLTGEAPWSLKYSRNSGTPVAINNITETWEGISIGATEFGTYTITEVSDANCNAEPTGTTVVSERTSPIATISGTKSKCPYETTTIPVALSGNGPWTFKYKIGDGPENTINVNQNVGSYVYNLAASSPGIYRITAVSDEDSDVGCVSSTTATITDYTLPSATFSSGPEVCQGAPTKLPVTLTGAAPWVVTYQHEDDAPVTDSIKVFENKELVVSGFGNYTILDVTDKNCDGSGSGEVEIVAAPEVNVEIDNTTQLYDDLEAPLTVNVEGGNFDSSDDDRPFEYSETDGWIFIPAFAYISLENKSEPFDIVYTYQDPTTQCYGKDSLAIFLLESVADIFLYDDSEGKRYCSNQDSITIYGRNSDNKTGTFSISGSQTGALVDKGDNTARLVPSVLQSGSYTVTYSVIINEELQQPKKTFSFENIEADFLWDNECFTNQSLVHFMDTSTASQGVELIDFKYRIALEDTILAFDTSEFSYIFENLATYPIEYIASSENCTDTIIRNLNLRPTIPVYESPYEEGFTDKSPYWSKGTNVVKGQISWTYGVPEGTSFEGEEGNNAWYTSIKNKQAAENSYVISPCFDFSQSDRPMLKMKTWQEFAETYDGANLQFKRRSDLNWTVVGASDQGVAWYNSTGIAGNPGGYSVGWSGNNTSWQTSKHDLNVLAGETEPVRFRIVYGTPAFSFNNQRDGFAFDDIWIGERSKKVLIEHFTNMNDTVSKRANTELNSLVNSLESDVIDIQIHMNRPSVDTFYLMNPNTAYSRDYYYNLPTVPYAIINGGNSQSEQVDFSTEAIDPGTIKLAVLEENVFNINLTATESNDVLLIDAEIVATADLGELNLTVHTVIIEKTVTKFTSIHDESSFENVVKAMVPNALGVNFSNQEWSDGTREYITLDYEYQNVFDKSEIRVVMFVQDEVTQEVYQVEMVDPEIPTSVDDPAPYNPLSEIRFYPNPASIHATALVGDLEGNNNRIEILDNTGRVIQEDKIYYGERQKMLDLYGFEPGIYMVRVISGKQVVGIGKLVVKNHY